MVRTSNQLVRNLISSLVLYGSVVTTEARAKNLKSEVEKLISRSKKLDLTVRRRLITSFSKDVATRLLEQVIPQFKDRVGGYARVIKLPHRLGDNAPMGRVEFVEEIKGSTSKRARKVRKNNAKNKSNKSK